MKKILFVSILLLAIVSVSNAQQKKYAGGIIFGEPTGLSGSYMIDSRSRINGAIGYSLFYGDGLHITADYITKTGYLLPVKNVDIPIYYGFGVSIKSSVGGDMGLGARGVGGITWMYHKYDTEFFFEIAPVFQLLPDTDLVFETGIGARYFFDLKKEGGN